MPGLPKNGGQPFVSKQKGKSKTKSSHSALASTTLSCFELLGFPETCFDGPVCLFRLLDLHFQGGSLTGRRCHSLQWLQDDDVAKLVGGPAFVNAYGACMCVARAEAAGGHWRCCIYDHFDPVSHSVAATATARHCSLCSTLQPALASNRHRHHCP